MISKLLQKAYWVEDLEGEPYISLDLHGGHEEEWKYLYNKVKAGFYLPRDREENGYFFENPGSDWMEVRDLKPTGQCILYKEEKETIIQCLELKVSEQVHDSPKSC